MSKTGQIVFILFIIFYMIFWGAIIFIGIPREERNKTQKKYDERQQIEQGRACKYALLTLICYLVGYILLDEFFLVKWCDLTFGLFLGIAFSLSVFLAYTVFQDAYFSYNESKPGALISLNCIGLCQLVMGIEHIVEGDVIQNGMITDNAINLLFFAVVLFLDTCFVIRKQLDKKII